MKLKMLGFFLLSACSVGYAQHIFKPGVGCYSKAELISIHDSITSLNQQIAESPGQARLYAKRGYYKSPTGDYTGALHDYDTAILLDKKYKNAYFSRGLMELHFNQCHEALSDFQMTFSFDATDCEALGAIGDAWFCMDSNAQALDYYNRSLACNPGNCNFLEALAYFQLKQKNYALALQATETAVGKGCNRLNLFALRGYISKEQKNYPEAVDAFTKAISLGAESNERLAEPESYARLFFDRGYCYDELDMHDKALGDYTQAIELNKQDKYALYNRGLLFINANKRKLAGADFYAAAVLGDADAVTYLHDKFPALYDKYLDQKYSAK